MISTILERVMMLIPVWLSLTVHEFAHGWSAEKLGDSTARQEGRLTLNPLAHIDPIGTLILPLMGVPFGWAKPVPVNPMNFDRKWNMRTGMLITAAAGPASNFLLAVFVSLLTGLILRFFPDVHSGSLLMAFIKLMVMMIQINVALALFNLIPIYPLDGSRIADGIMPNNLRPAWEKFCRYAPFLLIMIFIFGVGPLIQGPARILITWLLRLISGVAGI